MTLTLTTLNPLTAGTLRKLHSLNGGNGIVKVLTTFVETKSRMDVEFKTGPQILCDDWRQAQIAAQRTNFRCIVHGPTKFIEEGGDQRDVFVLPSTALVKEAEEYEEPETYIKEARKKFLGVFKRGLQSLGDDDAVSEMGFDGVMGILDSFYVLWELDEPEDEIKYQCSCYDFWHYYKCCHSLAFSITKKGVEIPAIYLITNIGSSKKRGRPRNAKGGEALGPKR